MTSDRTRAYMSRLVLLVFVLASCVCRGDETTNGTTQERYASPAAVFDAYRKARDEKDSRKVFSLLTPRKQNSMISGAFFFCAIRPSEETRAIVNRFVDGTGLEDEYNRRYQEKHGIDIAKFKAEHEQDPDYTPLPLDKDLQDEVFAGHVKDKAGFYEAAAKLADGRVHPLGRLEQVDIQGDTATGRAESRAIPPVDEPPRVMPSFYKTIRFKKINGGWLVD